MGELREAVRGQTPRRIRRILPSEQMKATISTYTSIIMKYSASGKHESADETSEAKPRMTFPFGEGGPLAVDEVFNS